jgi:hypothetical protein
VWGGGGGGGRGAGGRSGGGGGGLEGTGLLNFPRGTRPEVSRGWVNAGIVCVTACGRLGGEDTGGYYGWTSELDMAGGITGDMTPRRTHLPSQVDPGTRRARGGSGWRLGGRTRVGYYTKWVGLVNPTAPRRPSHPYHLS